MLRKHIFCLAKAYCDECEKEWEGHASDVGEDVWKHEDETGHDPEITEEWREEKVYDTEIQQVVDERVIE